MYICVPPTMMLKKGNIFISCRAYSEPLLIVGTWYKDKLKFKKFKSE